MKQLGGESEWENSLKKMVDIPWHCDKMDFVSGGYEMEVGNGER